MATKKAKKDSKGTKGTSKKAKGATKAKRGATKTKGKAKGKKKAKAEPKVRVVKTKAESRNEAAKAANAGLIPYLQWIGFAHYPDADSFLAEAKTMGVSKRVPHVAVASSLMEKGTVVFVAHADRNENDQCPRCSINRPCDNCGGAGKLALEDVDLPEHEFEHTVTPDGKKAIAEAGDDFNPAVAEIADLAAGRTKAKKVTAKVVRAALRKFDGTVTCWECEGAGKTKWGTGGTIRIDGKREAYRTYLKRCRQGRIEGREFDPDEHDLTDAHRCETCSGSGMLPKGYVVGFYLPEAIEFILPADGSTDPEKLAEMKDAGVRIVKESALSKEAKRGCGFRKPGGVYMVTDPKGKTTKATKDALAKLAEAGIVDPDEVHISGQFVRFLKPVKLEATKRFRGIKRWNLSPEAETEARMALEAMSE